DEVSQAAIVAHMENRRQGQVADVVVAAAQCGGMESELLGGADHARKVGSDPVSAEQRAQLLHGNGQPMIQGHRSQPAHPTVGALVGADTGETRQSRPSPFVSFSTRRGDDGVCNTPLMFTTSNFLPAKTRMQPGPRLGGPGGVFMKTP